MTETTIVVQIVLALITSGVVSGVVTYFVRRDANRTKLRLIELEAKREATRSDDANMAAALTVATTLAAAVTPLQTAIDNLTLVSRDLLDKSAQQWQVFMAKTDEMHAVTERRDKEFAQDRAARDAQHAVLMTRLDAQQKAIDEITRHLTVSTDDNTLRHEISKIVLRSDEIVGLARSLQPKESDPGQAKEPEPSKEETGKEATS